LTASERRSGKRCETSQNSRNCGNAVAGVLRQISSTRICAIRNATRKSGIAARRAWAGRTQTWTCNAFRLRANPRQQPWVNHSGPRAAQSAMDARVKAKMQGYEGEACGECGNYTLVRNGTCMSATPAAATSRLQLKHFEWSLMKRQHMKPIWSVSAAISRCLAPSLA